MALDRERVFGYYITNPQHGDSKTVSFACGLTQTEYLRTNAPSVSTVLFPCWDQATAEGTFVLRS